MPTVERTSQAEIITQRLAEIGMSVSAFARALEVEPSFIHAIKKGQRRITKPETVERAAAILGLPADELYVAGGHLPPDCLDDHSAPTHAGAGPSRTRRQT